ncbi:unnamed protein product [Parnassius apollo]|uniref:(apollo) hypothetical protein n=1 Tax=Parnassius apollo TaxID=110799 RepID=A0A8S3WT72_PARAO|nr:unnamed protein product [Parnassius apollo]
MTSYTVEQIDEYLGAAIDKLHGTPNPEVIHQGVTVPVQMAAGATTRGKTRRASKEGTSAPKRAKPRQRKTKAISEEDSDAERLSEEPPPPPSPNPPPSARHKEPGDQLYISIVYSLLMEVKDNQNKMMNMMHALTEQYDDDYSPLNSDSEEVDRVVEDDVWSDNEDAMADFVEDTSRQEDPDNNIASLESPNLEQNIENLSNNKTIAMVYTFSNKTKNKPAKRLNKLKSAEEISMSVHSDIHLRDVDLEQIENLNIIDFEKTSTDLDIFDLEDDQVLTQDDLSYLDHLELEITKKNDDIVPITVCENVDFAFPYIPDISSDSDNEDDCLQPVRNRKRHRIVSETESEDEIIQPSPRGCTSSSGNWYSPSGNQPKIIPFTETPDHYSECSVHQLHTKMEGNTSHKENHDPVTAMKTPVISTNPVVIKKRAEMVLDFQSHCIIKYGIPSR